MWIMGWLKRNKETKGKEREDFIEESELKINIGSAVKDMVDVKVSIEGIVKQMPFVLFLSVLVILYIANRYQAEKIVRESVRVKKERNELRSEHISIAAELMQDSKQSLVTKRVNWFQLGLVENTEPPIKLLVEKED